LIVLCSPVAASRPAVNEEVRLALLKSKPRTGHEIPHRLRDQRTC
jgi:hypothetical protein